MDSTTTIGSVALAYPELLAAGVLLLGLVLAFVMRSLSERGLVMLNRLLARFAGERDVFLSERWIRVLVTTVFWVLVVLTVAVAMQLLGLGRVFSWLDLPLAFLPRILVGVLIIAAGHVLGVLARRLLGRLSGAVGEGVLLPRLTQAAILVVGVMTGLQHMGLDVSFIGQLLILVLGAGIGGLALAFALGARRHVANLVAHAMVARYRPGDRIRIGDIEGVVIEVHRVGVDLVTDEGVVTVPAALFADRPVLRRTPTTGQDS